MSNTTNTEELLAEIERQIADANDRGAGDQDEGYEEYCSGKIAALKNMREWIKSRAGASRF